MVSPLRRRVRVNHTRKGLTMSIIDKLTGRAKQAAGDLTGDGSMRRKGVKEERKGEAKEDLARADEQAQAKADEVSRLERETDR